MYIVESANIHYIHIGILVYKHIGIYTYWYINILVYIHIGIYTYIYTIGDSFFYDWYNSFVKYFNFLRFG